MAAAATATLRRPSRRTLRSIGLYGGGLAIFAWSLGPFAWQLVTALQPDRELLRGTPKFLPIPATIEHFFNIFAAKQFHLYVINSIIVAGLTTLLCLVLGSLAAFTLARLDVRGRFGILGFILSVSMFPQIAIVAPLYLLATDLELLDTYTGLIIVYLGLGLPLVIWVLFGYFKSIPREIDDAARIDGAGPLRTLVQIIVPMAAPGIVATGLIGFIAAWNEFMFALAFTSDIHRQTAPVGIANFTELYYVPWGDIAAASVVITVPLVLMVLFFQRHIVAGLTQGAVKG
jgi:multiple sugar transport system permease protein